MYLFSPCEDFVTILLPSFRRQARIPWSGTYPSGQPIRGRLPLPLIDSSRGPYMTLFSGTLFFSESEICLRICRAWIWFQKKVKERGEWSVLPKRIKTLGFLHPLGMNRLLAKHLCNLSLVIRDISSGWMQHQQKHIH
jgi:hypothetical protein